MRVRRLVIGIVIVLALVAAGCSGDSGGSNASGDGGASAEGLTAEVMSTRPDMVTGGDVLIDVGDAGTTTPTVMVDGHTVKVRPVGGAWLVEALPDGELTLEVSVGDESTSVEVVNHPVEGPVFSGEHMPLLACSTETFDLGPSMPDHDCYAATKVDYLYGNADGVLQPLADPAQPPADLAQVTTTEGDTVDFIVRRERGVINRSVYVMSVLDPTPAGDPDDAPVWNGTLIYRFGGGCGTTFGQGGLLAGGDAPEYLSRGYAVATATFNTFQTQCNDVLSAETMMMVKEHFIEVFGAPVHTIGEGGSGGAIQQHLIIQNYPGLLDASVAVLPFPDAISIAPGVTDCGLLNRYYRSAAGMPLTPEQRAAINGHAVPDTCVLWELSFLEGIRPHDGCAPAIPESEIYDPETNRDGLRCALADANVNQVGIDSATGFANRPVDNIGVQYGLQALRDRLITVEQFLDLNAAIGGYDVDGNMIDERTVATEEALERVYATGRVSQGGGDQRTIPIIEINVYTDAAGDIHDRFRAFSLRDRLESPNLVIWTRGGGEVRDLTDVIGNLVTAGGGIGATAIATLEEWLDTGEKPEDAADNCTGPDGAIITGDDLYTEPGPCRDDYPMHGDPRTAAGAPRRNDILKCALRPIDPSDYEVELTAEQEERLRQLFPDGVCDWTTDGVGQVPLEGTWLRY
jgi:hypothetical protein